MTTAITGATGFLGLRLLPLLMARGGPVTVLGHSRSGDTIERIAAHFEATGVPIDAARALTVVNVDITQPRCALPHGQFQALARQFHEIWHCAGSIDLVGPPSKLRPVNVDGTRAVLDIAGAGTSMVYHVSTAMVAGRRRFGLIGEDDLDRSYGFENAYAGIEVRRRARRPRLV